MAESLADAWLACGGTLLRGAAEGVVYHCLLTREPLLPGSLTLQDLGLADLALLPLPADDAPLFRANLIERLEEAVERCQAARLLVADRSSSPLVGAAFEAARRRRIELVRFELERPLEINHSFDVGTAPGRKEEIGRLLGIADEAVSAAAALNRYRGVRAGLQAVEGAEAFDVEALHRTLAPISCGPDAETAAAADWPLISVVIRSMDRGSLEQAVASAAQQTWPRIEVVVVNAKGGGHRPVPSPRGAMAITLINDGGQPLGRAAAANAGLMAARGTFALLLDDDDLLYPSHLLNLHAALRRVPGRRVAYGGIRVEHYDTQGRLTGVADLGEPFDHRRLFLQNYIPIHAVLFELDLVRTLGCRFDESLTLYEDWDFWLQLAEHGDFLFVPGIGGVYRNFGGSGFDRAPGGGFEQRRRLREKWRVRADCALLTAALDFASDDANPWIRGWQERLAGVESALRSEIASQQAAAQELNRRIEALGGELAGLDTRLAASEGERRALDGRAQDLERQLATARDEAIRLRNHIGFMLASTSWRVTLPLRLVRISLPAARRGIARLRGVIAAHGGGLAGVRHLLARVLRSARRYGFRTTLGRILVHLRVFEALRAAQAPLPVAGGAAIELCPTPVPPPLCSTHPPVDIIVCVHNALDDVRRCLESVVAHTSAPYRLIVVDDGSGEETAGFVAGFIRANGGLHLRSDTATGYTLAANRGMRASDAPHLVLLNSDTVVGGEWLERLLRCAGSDPAIAMVGPLSNTASWQSIPRIEENGDWATNPLPEGWQVEEMAEAIAADALPLYPRLSFLNGFCLLIKRESIERIGYFDEENFARGYGEENDFSLRLHKQGLALAVADDVYVYHAQSRSYSHERRKKLGELAGQTLARKHGQALIDSLVAGCRDSRVLAGIRARSAVLPARAELRKAGRRRFGGRAVLFVLPAVDAGGGANIIVSEAMRMQRMGVEVALANLEANRESFSRAYPGLPVPVHYLRQSEALPALVRERGFDTVIASIYYTVAWLEPLAGSGVTLGYYVQDFEPLWFKPDNREYAVALSSYTRVPGMKLFCKTDWNRVEVERRTGASCVAVGLSYDIDQFRPRSERPEGRIVVSAMVRPYSPYRSPAMTMRVLARLKAAHPDRCELVTFGVDAQDPEFRAMLPQEPVQHLGKLNSGELALLLDRVEIFVDLSSYQAMGLTAMEAMACGAAVIVPQVGGAGEFARHEHNALVVDTADEEQCYRALERLLLDDELRRRLAANAMAEVVHFHPEAVAYAILDALSEEQAPLLAAAG